MISRRQWQAISLLAILSALCCCSPSTGAPPVTEPPPGDLSERDVAVENSLSPGPRVLQHPVRFKAITRAANILDERGEADSDAECLLRHPGRNNGPWMLEADIAAAVRPLPEPPEDLDERLDGSPSPVLAITRWGQIGTRSFDVAVATFTNSPPMPNRPGLFVAITNRGTYLRRTDRLVSAARTGPLSHSEVERALSEMLEQGEMIYVTAEADVGIDVVHRLLLTLPSSSPVALAVALAEEIRIPDPPEPPLERETGLCPDGLPPLSEASRGQLEASLIVGALGPLRGAVRECMSELAGIRAAGGLVEVALRIGEEGLVTEACLVSDELGGSQLRDCIVRAARAIRFPRPRPAGSVDVALPLRLRPSYQRPLCP